METYSRENYKEALRERLLSLRRYDRKYTFQNLAAHCRVQKTYLSRVLHDEKAHLSDDQLYLALEFLEFTDEEARFLTLLHDLNRSQLPKRRQALKRELEAWRNRALKTEKQVPKLQVAADPETLAAYYFDPDLQLLHMYLSIPKYAAAPEKIRERLGLGTERFTSLLEQLRKLGVIRLRGGVYEVVGEHFHLPAHSTLYTGYRANIRLRSLERLRHASPEETYSYSVAFTATAEDRLRIQEAFLEFLKRFHKTARAARSEEVFQLNFDLFGW